MDRISIALSVNGKPYQLAVEPRRLLADVLRRDLGFTGVHLGCEHGVCGACTVLLDGEVVRSCLMFAVQADGYEILTVEGLNTSGELHPVQRAFIEEFGFQCGFCTPGMILSAYRLLQEHPNPSEYEIRRALAGNLCRCTGYVDIVRSVQRAAVLLTQREAYRAP
ncbi:MAG: (2Fe-2S)-binding protein [Armatimonadetes bacterium]|nr:(2Fe-2S)-binding protein [Armatimonadota bacterium]MDW8153217.1 (2Fe-2S)-binding protein [Armatimonadota bacterium]